VQEFLRYLRRHHIGLLALFIALGGTSYAAVKLPRNSVGTTQLKKNAVISSKVKDGSLRAGDLAVGVLPSDFYSRSASDARFYTKPDSDARFYTKPASDGRYYTKPEIAARNYTRAESDSQFLATTAEAANSNLLDGRDSSDFVLGPGSLVQHQDTIPAGGISSKEFGGPAPGDPIQPHQFKLSYRCPSNLSDNGSVVFSTLGGYTVRVFIDNGSTNPSYQEVSLFHVDTPAAAGGEFITLHLRSSNGEMATVFVSSVHLASDCYWHFSAFLTE
jgi:hypothetical protein